MLRGVGTAPVGSARGGAGDRVHRRDRAGRIVRYRTRRAPPQPPAGAKPKLTVHALLVGMLARRRRARLGGVHAGQCGAASAAQAQGPPAAWDHSRAGTAVAGGHLRARAAPVAPYSTCSTTRRTRATRRRDLAEFERLTQPLRQPRMVGRLPPGSATVSKASTATPKIPPPRTSKTLASGASAASPPSTSCSRSSSPPSTCANSPDGAPAGGSTTRRLAAPSHSQQQQYRPGSQLRPTPPHAAQHAHQRSSHGSRDPYQPSWRRRQPIRRASITATPAAVPVPTVIRSISSPPTEVFRRWPWGGRGGS